MSDLEYRYGKKKKRRIIQGSEVLANDSSLYTEDNNFIFSPPIKRKKRNILDW